jgi:PAS domain S-box-containing protein
MEPVRRMRAKFLRLASKEPPLAKAESREQLAMPRGPSVALGAAVSALALPGAVGRLLEELGQRTIIAGHVARPLSALAFLGLGVSLVCVRREGRWREWIGRTTAFGVAMIGLAALLRATPGLSFPGLDRLPADLLPRPAMIGPVLLVGISLALGARSRVSAVFAGVAFALAVGTTYVALYRTDRVLWAAQLDATPDGLLASLLAALGALLPHRHVRAIAALTARDEAGATLRSYVAGAALIPTLLGALALEGGRAGLYRGETGTAVVALTSMIALVGLAFVSVGRLRRAERDRARVGAALAASEARYRHIFDRASVGIAQLASDGRWQQANEKLCAMLGYTPAELRDKTYGELSHLEDVTLDAQQWEMLRRGDIQDYGVERRFVSKQGEVVHADVRLVREIGADQVVRFIAVIQDITGRRLSEGTMRVYERAIASTQNGIVITDARKPDHPIISANDAFLAITGYPREAVLGKNCRFLNAKARDQAALGELRRAIERGESCSVLLRNHRADGTPFWNQLSVAPVEDSTGRVTHFVGTMTDATASVDLLAEREQVLAASRESQRAAETANDAKDRFLTVISHELRSPMSAILAWSSLLRDEPDPGRRTRALDAIDASVRAQTRLVDDLVVASRLRTGALGIEFSDVDLVAAVQAATNRLLPIAHEQGVMLETLLPSSGATCYGDAQRLEQVVHNLVHNAIKFTPRGGRVTVELTDERDRWSLEVRDTGRGLSRESLPRVFDEFWQVERKGSLQGGARGLGLGLAIVKHLVERHGGAVRAESAGPDLGSAFQVELPKRQGAARAQQPAPQSEPDAVAKPVDLAGAEVVIVEDDAELLEALGSAFARAGAVPRLTSSVSMALTFFAGLPEVLVSDIGLPDRDGLDLIRSVRALPEPARSVCAIAVTGRADAAERRKIHRAGFDAYFAKPVGAQAVVRRAAELRARLRQEVVPARRLLILADDRTRAAGLAEELRAAGHEVRAVADARAALREATQRAPDAILVPEDVDGPAVASLAEQLAAAKVPSVFVGLVDRDAEGERSHLDFVVSLRDTTALHRTLRFLEEPAR